MLPKGHAVREVIFNACVHDFLFKSKFPFMKEIEEYPEYGVDMLQAIRSTLKRGSLATSKQRRSYFQDPLTGHHFDLEHFCRGKD